MVGETKISYDIETEITAAEYEEMLKFIEQHYILPTPERFTDVRRTFVDQEHVLSFTFLEPEGKKFVRIEITAGKPVKVSLFPSDMAVPLQVLDRLKEDLFIIVELFEEKVRRTSLFFAYVEGEPVVLESGPQRRKNIIYIKCSLRAC